MPIWSKIAVTAGINSLIGNGKVYIKHLIRSGDWSDRARAPKNRGLFFLSVSEGIFGHGLRAVSGLAVKGSIMSFLRIHPKFQGGDYAKVVSNSDYLDFRGWNHDRSKQKIRFL